MTNHARVIGLGRSLAGDDGVGLAIAERVRTLEPELAVLDVRDAAELVELLTCDEPVILVDAVRTDRHVPGTLLDLTPGDLAKTVEPTSSHGLDVRQAIALAAALGAVSPRISIVGIAIGPVVQTDGFSSRVAASIEPAASRIVAAALT